MQVTVRNLKRYFGQTRAVDDITFMFGSGHVFGFVGPNGAGKTTTMRIMATLDEPTDGDIYLDGVSLVEEPEMARRLIGFVPDSLPSHRDITVHDYIDFFARAYGICGRQRMEMVDQIEEFTNLKGIRYKFLNALSKGMKQRVCLARALVHNPPVLVMDEPAAGLDPRARIELRELLKILAGQGKAILISSHILTELAEICDGTVIIEQGKILRAGTLEEIIACDKKAKSTVRLRPAGKYDELQKELLQTPSVLAVRAMGDEIEIDVDGDENRPQEILSMLILKGYRISEFKLQEMGLEDVFMSVTKGVVQ
jgi:ABC-2 type transport system ATP-binding protein